MELDAGEAPTLDDRGDALARRDRRRRLGGVRVREPVRGLVHIRPADARHALGLDPHRAAGDEPETGDAAVLLALLERELQPEADAERRLRARTEHVDEPAVAQALHRRARRADAGQHREVGGLHVVDQLGTEPCEGKLHRADVAGAVTADRNRLAHNTPFVEGSSAASPTRLASRSARPTALNAAPATWCESRPSALTCSVIRPACAKDSSTCRASPGSSASEISAPRRPPRSTAARASASSIGTTADP